MDYMEIYRMMHKTLDEDREQYALEQIELDKQNAADVKELVRLTRGQVIAEGMAIQGIGGQPGLYLHSRNTSKRGITPEEGVKFRGDSEGGMAVLHVADMDLPSQGVFYERSPAAYLMSDIHIGLPRTSMLNQAIAALAAGMSTMSFAMRDTFDDLSRFTDRIRNAWSVARPIGHLYNHAPIFLDSGVYWREKKYVHAIVIPRNQSRKDLAKNANRRNHTQRRNLKRDIVNAIKRK